MMETCGYDLVDVIGSLSDDETKEALELINEYGNDAFELLYDGESVEDVAEFLSDEYAACFIAGTKIKSLGGEKDIETLEVADEVYAFNP